MKKRSILAVGLATLLTAPLGLGKQAPPPQPAQAGPLVETSPAPSTSAPGGPALQRRNPRYQLCAGDVMDLVFTISPEFNQTVTIQPDGFISLQSVGDVHVEGQTVPQAVETIRQAYINILHDPVVSVSLKDFNKPYFIASGEVMKPGKFDLRGETTVSEAIATAGGFTDGAKQSEVLVFRRISDQWTEVKRINVKHLLHAQNLQEDPELHPGDMIWVPKGFIGKLKRVIPTSNIGILMNPLGL